MAALSRLTGESKTRAVIEALRERPEREPRLRDRKALSANLLEIGQRCAAYARHDRSRRIALRRAWPTPVIIDTSALLALLFAEQDAERFADAIAEAEVRLLSAASYV